MVTAHILTLMSVVVCAFVASKCIKSQKVVYVCAMFKDLKGTVLYHTAIKVPLDIMIIALVNTHL